MITLFTDIILAAFSILMSGACLHFANSLYNLKKYHVNFRTLIVSLLIFNSTYYFFVFVFEMVFIITGNNNFIDIMILVDFYILYGGIYYLQLFIFFERIIAVSCISRYELSSSEPPYVASLFILLSFGVTALHKIFITNIFEAYDIMSFEIIIFSVLSFLVYHYLHKKEINKRENDFLQYLTNNLSYKFQYYENQKTYSLTKNLLAILLVFESLRILSGVVLDSFTYCPNFSTIMYLTVFVLSIMKMIAHLYVFVLNEPKMRESFINLFSSRDRRNTESGNNLALYVNSNTLESTKRGRVYFYGYRRQRD
uniref:7TM_GPCR_Srx domain-containing protein n=1 Tax=Strongyloides venezuelensis TaxID=75913 RepID=A0A0K0G487_STRVS